MFVKIFAKKKFVKNLSPKKNIIFFPAKGLILAQRLTFTGCLVKVVNSAATCQRLAQIVEQYLFAATYYN